MVLADLGSVIVLAVNFEYRIYFIMGRQQVAQMAPDLGNRRLILVFLSAAFHCFFMIGCIIISPLLPW